MGQLDYKNSVRGRLKPIGMKDPVEGETDSTPGIRVLGSGTKFTEDLNTGDQIVPKSLVTDDDRMGHERTVVKIVSDTELWGNKPFAEEFQFIEQKMKVAHPMDQAIQISGFVAYLGRNKTKANEVTEREAVDLPKLGDDSFYLVMTRSKLRECFGGERFWMYLMRPEMIADVNYSNKEYDHGKWHAVPFILTERINDQIAVLTREIQPSAGDVYYGNYNQISDLTDYFRMDDDGLVPGKKYSLNEETHELDAPVSRYYYAIDIYDHCSVQRIVRHSLAAEDASCGIGSAGITSDTGDLYTTVSGGDNLTFWSYDHPYTWTNTSSGKPTKIGMIRTKSKVQMAKPVSENSRFVSAIAVVEKAYPHTPCLYEETEEDGAGIVEVAHYGSADGLTVTGEGTDFRSDFLINSNRARNVLGLTRIIFTSDQYNIIKNNHNGRAIRETSRRNGEIDETTMRIDETLTKKGDSIRNATYKVLRMAQPFDGFQPSSQGWATPQGIRLAKKMWGLQTDHGLKITPPGMV